MSFSGGTECGLEEQKGLVETLEFLSHVGQKPDYHASSKNWLWSLLLDSHPLKIGHVHGAEHNDTCLRCFQNYPKDNLIQWVSIFPVNDLHLFI